MARPPRRPPAAPPSSSKLLLIDSVSDRPAEEHPDVAALLRDGWTLVGAEPRIVEPGRSCLLVTLARRGVVARAA